MIEKQVVDMQTFALPEINPRSSVNKISNLIN